MNSDCRCYRSSHVGGQHDVTWKCSISIITITLAVSFIRPMTHQIVLELPRWVRRGHPCQLNGVVVGDRGIKVLRLGGGWLNGEDGKRFRIQEHHFLWLTQQKILNFHNAFQFLCILCYQLDCSWLQGLSIEEFTNLMHTILTQVVPDSMKACQRFVRRSNKWIPSIEIPLLGTG